MTTSRLKWERANHGILSGGEGEEISRSLYADQPADRQSFSPPLHNMCASGPGQARNLAPSARFIAVDLLVSPPPFFTVAVEDCNRAPSHFIPIPRFSTPRARWRRREYQVRTSLNRRYSLNILKNPPVPIWKLGTAPHSQRHEGIRCDPTSHGRRVERWAWGNWVGNSTHRRTCPGSN